MTRTKLSSSSRLVAVIGISCSFFLVEIAVGFYTHSLALVADAFHYLNDLLGFVVALVALRLTETTKNPPPILPFGWQRARVLGAFFNGALLLALAISVFLQSVERFISVHYVENPMLIFIMGCVGLGLNVVSALFLHEHHHDHDPDHHQEPPVVLDIPLSEHMRSAEPYKTPETSQIQLPINYHHNHNHVYNTNTNTGTRKRHRDLGTMAALVHVLADAANNLGVMASALVIWLARFDGRFYADPAASMGIAVMILLSAFPVLRRSGWILLECVPANVEVGLVRGDLEKIPGVHSIKTLHIWALNQTKTLATVHLVLSTSTTGTSTSTSTSTSTTTNAYAGTGTGTGTASTSETSTALSASNSNLTSNSNINSNINSNTNSNSNTNANTDELPNKEITVDSVEKLGQVLRIVGECLGAYGVDGVTVQPEFC